MRAATVTDKNRNRLVALIERDGGDTHPGRLVLTDTLHAGSTLARCSLDTHGRPRVPLLPGHEGGLPFIESAKIPSPKTR